MKFINIFFPIYIRINSTVTLIYLMIFQNPNPKYSYRPKSWEIEANIYDVNEMILIDDTY